MGLPGRRQAVACIEDCAVAVDDLAPFIGDVDRLLDQHHVSCVHYGHAAAGELHLRPRLDLRDSEDQQRFTDITEAVADIVASYRGSLSGEHGDGRVRSALLERVYGRPLVELWHQVKELFDPQHILNPGIIIQPQSRHLNWRVAQPHHYDDKQHHPQPTATPSVPRKPITTHFNWSQGLLTATEQCNGAGVCRQSLQHGAMCPTYQATLEEVDSTEGGQISCAAPCVLRILGKPCQINELVAALDSCLSCKACASECPANVDLARLKAEVLSQLPATPSQRRIARYGSLMQRASQWPRLANWLAKRPISKSWFGIEKRAELPPIARTTVHHLVAKHGQSTENTQIDAVLVIDEFTNAHDPHIAQAALKILLLFNLKVDVYCLVDSGRAAISQGQLDLAQAAMQQWSNDLTRYPADIPIIGLEPSAFLGLSDEARDLLPELSEQIDQQHQRTLLIEEFLQQQPQHLWDQLP